MMMKLGSTIEYVRLAKRMLQVDAAEALGISHVYLCYLEHDKRQPSLKLLDKMFKLWGVDIYMLAWHLDGDLTKLPKGVRKEMRALGLAWMSVPMHVR